MSLPPCRVGISERHPFQRHLPEDASGEGYSEVPVEEEGNVIERLTQTPVPVMFTLWLSLCIGSIVTTVLVRRFTPRLAKRRRICFPCGYDLRGNPEATTCPEWGAVVPWINQESNRRQPRPLR